MTEEEIYSEKLINYSKIDDFNGILDVNPKYIVNSSCGDEIYIYLIVEDGIIQDIKYTGNLCAISKASTNLMCKVLIEENIVKAKEIIQNLLVMTLGGEELKKINTKNKEYNDLEIFKFSSYMPGRIKCVTLPWHGIISIIDEIK